MSSFEDRLNQDVEGWRPEPGDSIQGTVVAVDSRPSDYGDDYPLIEIEKEDGSVVAVHAFHTVLKREISRLAPAAGDKIGIRYSGKEKGRNQDYEKYRVLLDRATSKAPASPDWDAMKAEAEGEVAAGVAAGAADPFAPREGEEQF
jgi:hypothetical protein